MRLVISFSFLISSFLSYSQTTKIELTSNWQFRKHGDTVWMQATVPGTVHTDLLALNKIADPFLSVNEQLVQWIDTCDWEYTSSFYNNDSNSTKNAYLQFEGLDTHADVYLNDSLILQADNMFRTWKIKCSGLLKEGKNQLLIKFHSAVKNGYKNVAKHTYTLPGGERVFTRKAAYHFGWDWGPRFVSVGIWKPVSIVFEEGTYQIHHHQVIQQSLTDSKAELQVLTYTTNPRDKKLTVKIFDHSTNKLLGESIHSPNSNSTNYITTNVLIKNPKRWWTNGLGKAHLYTLRIEVSDEDSETIVQYQRVGLRTLELIQESDAFGKSFYFKLNGHNVFAKGANIIPLDNFLPRVKSNDYAGIVTEAREVNINMLRVWGGGIYPDDAFYNACDEQGILVWQDFMFAGAMYPGNTPFLDNVKAEIEEQVIRLRNHPSMALWCGNNEISEAWHNWGWQKQYKYSIKDSTKIWDDYLTLFENLIPTILQQLDATRPYWPSSPQHGWGREQSMKEGDSHYWGVWWGLQPFEIYNDKMGRFMSEYGFQSIPSIYTLNKLSAEKLSLQSEVIRSHQKHPTGFENIDHYMKDWYHIPTEFSDYIYVSQLLQAEGMKIAIEAHRRKMPYCMGSLYWQLNDCWPVTSWSTLDHLEQKKAAHYIVKNAFAQTILSVNKNNNQYDIYVVSDNLSNQSVSMKSTLLTLDGLVKWRDIKELNIAGNTSQLVLSLDSATLLKGVDLSNSLLSIELVSAKKKLIAKQIYYFKYPKELALSKPNITIKKTGNSFTVQSNVLAKNVFLDAGEQTSFSHNYFDLLPKESKIIHVTSPLSLDSIIQKLQIKTLVDTYKP